VGKDQIVLKPPFEESTFLCEPWPIEQFGQLMCTTATLLPRPQPYSLLRELARGKLHQLRGQVWDWCTNGIPLAPSVKTELAEVNRMFARVALEQAPAQVEAEATRVLSRTFALAHEVTRTYVERVLEVSHKRTPRLFKHLSCRVGTTPPSREQGELLGQACTSVTLPISWFAVEGQEAHYRWEETDRLVDWALAQGFDITAGPLIDFSAHRLPRWLWVWERDPLSMATFMCRFVEAAVRRYRSRIQRWLLTRNSNVASVLNLSEDDMLGVTQRLVETARQAGSGLELIVGIAQPWGEYLIDRSNRYTPVDFADELTRSRLGLSRIDLEIVMGVTPGGSYCRDLMELSRLLDAYAWLGVGLHVTLGYPSSPDKDPQADTEQRVPMGWWREGVSPETQADWIADFAPLALCKPFVHQLTWTHLSDADRHHFPHCGLLDSQQRPKPALQALARLRQEHL
jgi:hypothetical protein